MTAMERINREVDVETASAKLQGDLSVPSHAQGLVLFAHGSGSGRRSPRNQFVAQGLTEAGLATLLLDLLTAEEQKFDEHTMQLRFDVGLLGARVLVATDWILNNEELHDLNLGYFGASTGAAAALIAAAKRPEEVHAVVSRGGRPDLAEDALFAVRAPTLFIVRSRDAPTRAVNEHALPQMPAPTELSIVPGAGHLFEEPGALETVVKLTRGWFLRYLP